MKTLQESLFDADLANKDLCLNDLYDFDCWPSHSGSNDWMYASDMMDICYGYYNAKKVKRKDNALYKMLHKAPFNKIIKKTEQDWDIDNNFDSPEYDYSINLYLITWFVMSCTDEKQIKRDLKDLLLKANRIKNPEDVKKYDDITNNVHLRYSTWEKVLKNVEIEILHDPHDNDTIRMIVIKLYTNRADFNSVIYMTLNKK